MSIFTAGPGARRLLPISRAARVSRAQATRNLFLLGTILGGGVLTGLAPQARAADVVELITTPQTELTYSTSGSDNITITTSGSGTITSGSTLGPSALTVVTASGNATVNLGAAVTGGLQGVVVAASGAGNVTITSQAAGTVESFGTLWAPHKANAFSISAESHGGKIDIGGVAGLGGTVTGGQGIRAKTTLAGTVDIKTAAGATVTGNVRFGVDTEAEDGDTNVSLGANVTGTVFGVSGHSVSGNITVTSAAGVSITSTDGDGMNVDSSTGSIDIGGTTGLTGLVQGGGGAINVLTGGAGKVTITTATGGVLKGLGDTAIISRAGTGDTLITLGDSVSGWLSGVDAVGGGSVTLTTAAGASVTGTSLTGIKLKSLAGNVVLGGVAGLSGSVTGGYDGILANTDAGSITIKTATGGAIEGRQGSGITTNATGGPTSISLGANVTGATTAVDAYANGVQAITITSGAGAAITSTATGFNAELQSTFGFGISARGGGGAIDVGGAAGLGGPVTGNGGIRAWNTGAGNINIKTAAGATVTGSSRGIITSTEAGDTTIALGAAVSGRVNGIWADSDTGSITITSGTGASVTGGDDNEGMKLRSVSGNIDVGGAAGLAGAVTGGSSGIFAEAQGGNIRIKTTTGGVVTATGDDYNAIDAYAAGDVTISLGAAVRAPASGVNVEASGAITLETTAEGTVSARFGIALYSVGDINVGGATGLAGAINSYAGGIYANARSGSITVKTVAGGTVTNTRGNGIETSAAGNATTISLGANVTAGNYGVKATAGGDISITSASDVAISGAGGSGISAESTGGAVRIGGAAGLGGPVTGATGIYADVAGSKTIEVKANANVTGTVDAGISTLAVNGATTISIGAAATVTGSTYAIQSTSQSGPVTIDNAGLVKGALLGSGGGTRTFNNSGGLVLMGAQSNAGFTVNNLSGGVLNGTGAFGAVTAQAGSFVRPGDRAGTTMGVMTMSSLNMAAGAKLEVRADVSGVNDRLVVNGAAAIADNATLRLLAAPQTNAAWSATKRFTVLSAGTLTGNFTNTETDYAFLSVIAVREGNDVIATLARNWVSFRSYAMTPNQIAVSNTLDKFQSQSENPLIASATTMTVAQAPHGLTQLAGAGLAVARRQAFMASGVLTEAIDSELGRFTGSISGASMRADAPDRPLRTMAFDKVAETTAPFSDGRLWAQALGGAEMTRPDADNPAERLSLMGLAAGADAPLTPNLRAGFAFAGGQSGAKVSSLGAKADATWGQGAVYAVATADESYAKAVLVYGHLRTDTTRVVTSFPTPETAKGKFGANLFTMRFEVGQKIVSDGPVHVTPFLAVEHSWLMQNGFSETGAPTVGLTYGKATARDLPATLGVKFDAAFALEGLQVRPSAAFGWVHDFADRDRLAPSFTSLAGSTFTLTTTRGDRNLVRTELNLEAAPEGGAASFHARARADVGARTTHMRGTAGVTMRF